MTGVKIVQLILRALSATGHMAWQIGWSLILGFAIASVIQALVHKNTISRLLPDDRPASLAKAAGFGAASSSCSYAAVAMARTWCARARTSPRRWSSRSPRPTWSWNWESSWPC